MTVHETPVGHLDNERDGRDDGLELLTDDGGTWTAVPPDSTGEARVTRWISVETDLLCDLAAWR